MAQARILLITANLEASDIWNYALTRAGFDVFQFADAAAALAWRKENPSDVVLIAEDAAVLDGVALLQQLRPDVAAPVLLATSGDTPRVLEAYRAGADECIGLPIYPELFIAKVKAWLRHSSTVKIGLEIPKMIRSKIPRTNGQRDGRHLLL
jgi:DNA-binding response OmpR family regulator